MYQSPTSPRSLGLFHFKDTRFVKSLVVTGLVWFGVLAWWLAYEPAAGLVPRVPGMDNAPREVSTDAGSGAVQIGAFFALHDGVASEIPGSWQQFRGPGRDNAVFSTPPLAHAFGNTPPILWSVELGEGHAAPAVANGRVFVLDYDEETDADALRAFSLSTGKEIWRRWYEVKVKRNHGMSRTIPAVADSFVVTMGPRCHVMCTRAGSGDFMWGIDLVEEYGAEVPLWYTGQCPLIDDSIAVLAPSGKSLMIGVDCHTGEVLWETPNPHGWKMSHSSIMPMQYGGRKIYLYCASGGLAGVAADGPDRGSILFQTDSFNQSVVAPSPVVLGDGRIFMTAGYGGGSAIFQVSHSEHAFGIEMIDRIDVKEGASSEQQTPLYHEGHLFMVLPKDAGELRGQFVCVDPDTPRKIIWSSGPERKFGLGPYLLADNKLYILNDNGTLSIARFSTRRYEELGRIQIMDAVDAWGPMALVNGRLIIRDAGSMVALDIRRKTGV